MPRKKNIVETERICINISKCKYYCSPSVIQADVRLSAADKSVYGYISSICNYKNGLGWCYATENNIANDLGYSRESVSKSINKLKKLKLIEVNGHRRRTLEKVTCELPKNLVNRLLKKASPKTNSRTTSYNINLLEKIDTLDFIDDTK